MSRTYFGTDGIRGTVGQPPITPDFVLRLAHAVGRVLKRTEERPTVLIGKDTRISGYMLESALESGFNSAGVDVVLLGPLPTPGVAYLTRAQRASLGVVISASHNPFADNGIKFFSAQGTKLPDALGAWRSKRRSRSRRCGPIRPAWARRAAWTTRPGRYIEFCKSTFANDLTLKGLTHRGRRGPRRGVPHRAQGVPRAGRRGALHRLRARRPEHQRRGAAPPIREALVDAVRDARRRLRHRAGRRCRPAADGRRATAASTTATNCCT